jgi:hypothetical protein
MSSNAIAPFPEYQNHLMSLKLELDFPRTFRRHAKSLAYVLNLASKCKSSSYLSVFPLVFVSLALCHIGSTSEDRKVICRSLAQTPHHESHSLCGLIFLRTLCCFERPLCCLLLLLLLSHLQHLMCEVAKFSVASTVVDAVTKSPSALDDVCR